MSELRLILVDPKVELSMSWNRWFRDPRTDKLWEGIEIHQGLFQELTDADAVVTAGNSFGLMDGGVDLAVAMAFPGVERAVQNRIGDRWRGELPVGAAITVAIEHHGDSRYRNVVYAPTMRVPADIRGTDNVYRAMWAALVETAWVNRATRSQAEVWDEATRAHIIGHSLDRMPPNPFRIETLAVPGLGTHTGRMSAPEAARQMSLAWRNFQAGAQTRPTWSNAARRDEEINDVVDIAKGVP